MKHLKMGESISREWDDDPLKKDIWHALQLIKNDAFAGAQELQILSKRGSALSMMYLGHAFFIGRYGLERDQVLGEDWLRKSIEAGSIEACYVLAKLFQDSGKAGEALNLFKKVAELGYSPAMFAVGQIYYFGQGVDRNVEIAHKYFKKAAAEGHLYGILWESGTLRERRRNAVTWIRNLSIRIPLVFRLTYVLVKYPSSDRLRK